MREPATLAMAINMLGHFVNIRHPSVGVSLDRVETVYVICTDENEQFTPCALSRTANGKGLA
jgi:hypothetical protein